MSEHRDAMNKRIASGPMDEPWMLTKGGKVFKLLSPWENEYTPGDVAWLLARQFRFHGCSPMSVARHSLLVSRAIAHKSRTSRWKAHYGMAGLLHDIEEAWLGDMPTPLKRECPDYCAICDEVRQAALDVIWPEECRDGFDFFSSSVLHEVDSRMASLERNYLFPESVDWPINNDISPETYGLKEEDFTKDTTRYMDECAWFREYLQLKSQMAAEVVGWDCL